MIGILAEKPSAMRNMAKALGGVSGTYNGELYTLVAARGHLYEFVDPEKQVNPNLSAQYKSWDLANLPWNESDFSWKRQKKPDTASTLSQIKTVLSKCDEVCIATDDDPTGEGELLAWEILDELHIRAKKWTRMYFTDESVKSIQKAFSGRKTIPSMSQDMDYVKAFYRSKWDFMSMQFTRIATKCGDGVSVLRQGRLKSAMVSLVGDALKAVNAYKKIPYYQNRFRDENGIVYSNPDEPLFPKKTDVPNSYEHADVVVDSKSMKSTAPPKLLDLASLAARLAPKGYKAKQVLEVYQKMYESQVVSYPRTEDKVITPEQFNDLLPFVDKIAHVVGVDTSLLTHRTPRSTHVKTGGAHGANRPGPNVPNSLNDLNQYGSCASAIYEILARNYLAMLAEDYEYENQKGHLKQYPAFTGSANVPKKLGFKAVFQDDDEEMDDSSSGLGTKASPFVYEGFPPKPPTPTFKWLKNQLEKHDVGTGATQTSIYADVTNEKAKYPLLIDTKGKITMTQYGQMSYLLIQNTNIGNLQITEQLMKEMRDIAAGKANPDVCLHQMQRYVMEDLETMKKNGVTMRKELGIMEQTQNQKERATGVWNGKQVSFNREWGGHRFTDEEVDALLAGDEINVLGLVSKAGKTYGVKGKLSEQTYNGSKFVGFERTGFADSNSVQDSWCQHTFTADEKAQLEAGCTIHLDGCVSKKGNVFSCDVKFGETDRGGKGIIPIFN